MRTAIITSAVALLLGVEWLSLMVLAMWALGGAMWLIKQAGDHGAL